jgi:hypothetical protein
MPQCDFFAVGDDFTPILDFVFSQPGWVLVESASRHDLPLRRFASTSDVLAAFDLERGMTHLLLHAPETGGAIREKRITFSPTYARQSGATGRTDAGGWGLIQLFFEPGTPARIGVSFSNCHTESSAREREFVLRNDLGPVDDWDMHEVKRVSERLNRRIRRLGVRKEGSAAVLERAAEIAAAGTATLGGPRRDVA